MVIKFQPHFLPFCINNNSKRKIEQRQHNPHRSTQKNCHRHGLAAECCNHRSNKDVLCVLQLPFTFPDLLTTHIDTTMRTKRTGRQLSRKHSRTHCFHHFRYAPLPLLTIHQRAKGAPRVVVFGERGKVKCSPMSVLLQVLLNRDAHAAPKYLYFFPCPSCCNRGAQVEYQLTAAATAT